MTSSKVDNGTLKSKDLSRNTRKRLHGKAGPQGPKGDTGPPGPAGQALVAQRLTASNPTYDGINVVDAPALPLNSGGPGASSSDGTALFGSVNLPEGQYRVEGTVQFFDFDGDATVGSEYGVARVFLNGANQGTLWSGDVPDDGNNAAQTSASTIINVPSGGGTLSVRAAFRSAEGNDGGQVGGNLIVTSIG